jgi:hypothetical protein
MMTGILLVAMLGTTGCMTQSAGIAPSTTPITGRDTYTVIGQKSTGRAWGFLNLVLIPIAMGEMHPSKSATTRAIRKGGGNGLVEVTQNNTMINLLFVCILITRVDGTPVNIERGSGI